MSIVKWIAHPYEAEPLISNRESSKENNSILLLIGPEGGFSDSEVELAKRHHWSPVDFGERILRVETAAIYAAAQIIALKQS